MSRAAVRLLPVTMPVRFFPVALALFCAVAVTSPAFAYRRAYDVTLNGTVLAGSEVCFFRGSSSDDPFRLFFAQTRVSCLPADRVLDFPPGLYHAFARNVLTGHVSAHRDYFIYPEPPRPEQGYEELEIPVVAGGWAEFSDLRRRLAAGQSLGVWLAATPTASGTFFPLADGEDALLVPADTPFVPLLLERGVPVALGEPAELSSGSRRKMRLAAQTSGRGDLIAWLDVDRNSLQPHDSSAEPPEITLVAAGETFAPAFPILQTAGSGARNSLVFFRSVPAGSARLRVRGALWAESDREVNVASGGATVEFAPLVLSARGAVAVAWGSPASSPVSERCPTRSVPRPATRAWLSRCSAGGETRTCETVAEASAAFASGALQLRGLQPGAYELAVQPPFSEPVRMPLVVQLGSETRTAIPVDPFRFHGRVTLNGKPAEARILFFSGEAASDPSGSYDAALAADPLTNLVRVVLCADGRALTHIPAEPITRNGVYDIDLRLRSLDVRVKDEAGAPVEGATVRYLPVKEVTANGPVIFYSSPTRATGGDGSVAFDDVPDQHRLQVCAAHSDFVDTCTSVFTLSEVRDKGATVTLRRPMRRGKVEGHQGWGVLAFVAGTRVVEEVALAPDGTFTLKSSHRHPEHAVYVSERAPLTVLPLPLQVDETREWILARPRAASRSFTVRVAPTVRDPGFVGLWIGDHYVPLTLLAYHQDHRGGDVVVSADRPLVVQQIAATLPLSVAFARRDPSATVFVDPFTQPEYSGVERVPVTSDSLQLPRQ